MYKFIRPLLYQINPEHAHNIAHFAGKLSASIPGVNSLISKNLSVQSTVLQNSIWGIKFNNPIGIAAGFDKNAQIISSLAALGFGFIEVGSVTASPSRGNPKPRLFRLTKDEAIINRMGLLNNGAKALSESLKGHKFQIPVGINIAKTHSCSNNKSNNTNPIEDYCTSIKLVKNLGNYKVLNVSCPNTIDGKTFEDPNSLKDLLAQVKEHHPIKQPLLVKLSADSNTSEFHKILEVTESLKVDGYILCNTTKNRNNLKTNASYLKSIGNGGSKWSSTQGIVNRKSKASLQRD